MWDKVFFTGSKIHVFSQAKPQSCRQEVWRFSVFFVGIFKVDVSTCSVANVVVVRGAYLHTTVSTKECKGYVFFLRRVKCQNTL